MKHALLVFLLIASVATAGCVKKNTARTRAKDRAEKQEETASGVDIDMDLAQQILWPKSYDVKISRDPFEPLSGMPVTVITPSGSTEIAPATLKVVGILCKQEGSVALLESSEGPQVLRQGDKIGQCIIKKIETKQVTIEENGKEFILELGEEE